MFNTPFHQSGGQQQTSPLSKPSTSRVSIGQDDKQPILDNSPQHAHHSGSQVGRDSDIFESEHPHHHGEEIPEAKFDPIATNYNPEVNNQRGISTIDRETIGKGSSQVYRGEPTADHERPPRFEDY